MEEGWITHHQDETVLAERKHEEEEGRKEAKGQAKKKAIREDEGGGEEEVAKLKAEVEALRSRLKQLESKPVPPGEDEVAEEECQQPTKGIEFAAWGNTSLTRAPKAKCASAKLMSYSSGSKKWKDRVLVFYPKGMRVVKPYTEVLCYDFKWKHVRQWATNPAQNLFKVVVEQVDIGSAETYMFKLVSMDVQEVEKVVWRFVTKRLRAGGKGHNDTAAASERQNQGRRPSKDSANISKKGGSGSREEEKGVLGSFWQKGVGHVKAFKDFVVHNEAAELNSAAGGRGRKDTSLFRSN